MSYVMQCSRLFGHACSMKYCAMKTWRSGSIASQILNVGLR